MVLDAEVKKKSGEPGEKSIGSGEPVTTAGWRAAATNTCRGPTGDDSDGYGEVSLASSAPRAMAAAEAASPRGRLHGACRRGEGGGGRGDGRQWRGTELTKRAGGKARRFRWYDNL